MTTMRDKQTAARRGALGKGISSLLGEAESKAPAGGGGTSPHHQQPSAAASTGGDAAMAAAKRPPTSDIVRLDIDLVDANPQQPRKYFDEGALSELSESLRQDGLLQPIIVTRGESQGRYMIIAGERRWRASKLAGLTTIPAIVKEGASDDMLRLALIENIQRSDLNIIEEAEAYAALIKDYGLTQEQCADRVGKDRSTVTNTLRLLGLPREIQDDIMDGRLSMGHGRCLLSLDDRKLMLRARDIVIKKCLSVRQTEQLCKSIKGGKKHDGGEGALVKEDADLAYITENLRSYLHTKVRMVGSPARGRIEISYFSSGELERLLKLMGHSF